MKKSLFIFLISLLAFINCNVSHVLPPSGSNGDTNLVLHFDTNDSRTILPDVIPDIYEYKTTCTGPEIEIPTYTTDSSLELNLNEGLWNVEVQALNANTETIALGFIENIEIVSGNIIDITVYLYPIQNGENTGNIDITINWPITQMIDSTTAVKLNDSDYEIGSIYPGTTFNIVDTTMTFQVTDISSDNYVFVSFLNLNNEVQATVTESIQVFDNLTSSAFIELSIDDFTLPPDKPIITSSMAENNQIVLIWENSSPVVTHYSIERSLFESSGYSLLTTTDGQTLTYSDPDIDSMTTYYYRIIASSTGGDSEPSDFIAISIEPPEPGNGGSIIFSETTNTTTILSWVKASDNISASETLMYKVVRSESNDIDTISNAESNGLLVQDWISDINTIPLTGLNSGATYFFNIMVRDEAGNIQIYTMNSETLTSNGQLELTITVIEPGVETITFSENDDITVSQASIFTIFISELFDSYEWYLDGIQINDQLDNSFEYACNGIPLGVHHLTVFVTKNGMLYSKTIRFIVQN